MRLQRCDLGATPDRTRSPITNAGSRTRAGGRPARGLVWDAFADVARLGPNNVRSVHNPHVAGAIEPPPRRRRSMCARRQSGTSEILVPLSASIDAHPRTSKPMIISESLGNRGLSERNKRIGSPVV